MRPNWVQLNQVLTGLVPEASEDDENQIQKPADPEEADCEQPDDAGADLANIETMDAETTQEQAQEEGNPFALVDIPIVFVNVGVLIHHIDYRLLGSRIVLSCIVLDRIVLRCSAVRAEFCVSVNYAAAIFAIHNHTSFFCALIGHIL